MQEVKKKQKMKQEIDQERNTIKTINIWEDTKKKELD